MISNTISTSFTVYLLEANWEPDVVSIRLPAFMEMVDEKGRKINCKGVSACEISFTWANPS